MIAFIASSKLNGWSETGLAFGIEHLPMVSVVAHSSADTSSEYASAAAYSASCYERREDIGVLAVVMPERKLCQVQAPKAIQICRMDLPRTYSPCT